MKASLHFIRSLFPITPVNGIFEQELGRECGKVPRVCHIVKHLSLQMCAAKNPCECALAGVRCKMGAACACDVGAMSQVLHLHVTWEP